jgi:Methylase of chemotaxis methyl-accepting proteins
MVIPWRSGLDQGEIFHPVKKDHYRILPQIRRMVKFSYLNFVEDVYPALMNGTNAMDLILCRNVLMYFRQSYAQQVIANLHRSLVEGGWLIVSPVETSHILFTSFAAISFHGMTLYTKTLEPIRRAEDLGHGFEPAILKIETEEVKPFTDYPEPAITPLDETIQPLTTAVEQPVNMPPESDWYDASLELYLQGHYTEAANKITGKLSEIPDDTQAIELLARTLANQGQLVEAAEWCEKAINGDRLNAGCHYLRAMIEQELGKFNEAITSLKRALYINPDFVLAHFALGNLVRLQGKPKEAEKHFANALSLLKALRPEDILPQSEGMTVGRLMEIIQPTTFHRTAA